MKGSKLLFMCVFIMLGLGVLLSGSDNVICCMFLCVMVLSLKGLLMGVSLMLIFLGIVMLFFLVSCMEVFVVFLLMVVKNWLNLFVMDFSFFE